MKFKDLLEQYGERELTDKGLEQLEKLLKPIKKGIWKPRAGETYYCINSQLDIMAILWTNDKFDDYHYSKHNVFKTKKEAERSLEIHKACYEASFEPDWDDLNQHKYCLYYSYDEDFGGRVDIWGLFVSVGWLYYFPTQEIAQELIDKFGKEDIKKYVLHVYD